MKTKKKQKKIYRKTKILPIFNGRYNKKRLNRKESELYLLRVFRVELAFYTVFQKHVSLWALIIVIVYHLDEENFENYQKNSKKKELFLCFCFCFRKESELYLLRVFRVELAFYTVFQNTFFYEHWSLLSCITWMKKILKIIKKTPKRKNCFCVLQKFCQNFYLLKNVFSF